MSMMQLLSQALGGNTQQQISQQLGTNPQQTQNAISAALPLLMSAMARNASQSPQGAEALSQALSRDHDGSVLDNLGGLFSGQAAPQQPKAADGAGILRHLLGGQQQAVQAGLSQASGMDAASTSKLLAMLAPAVMGAAGQAQRQNNFSPSQLAGFLGQQQREAQQTAPTSQGLISRLLDADGDGQVEMGEIATKGFGLFKTLGRLMGR